MTTSSVPALKVNVINYLEFELNDVKYYILKNIADQTKASGFSSELDTHMYFINKEMPNERLVTALEYAKMHYLKEDLTIIF